MSTSLPIRENPPRIAIIGAGPSGLTLARILHINNIPVTIFEREASSSARSQGGTLDLHPRAGQAAIKKANLRNEYQQHVRYDGQDFVLVDYRTNERYVDLKDTDTERPEIDRTKLRQILLDSLPEGVIRWGSNLRSVSPDGTLHFEHGDETDFDLIVGADGGWSKIRSQLTPLKPHYSGVSGFDIKINDIDVKHPALGKMVGRGNFFSFGEAEGRVMLAQRGGDGGVRVYCMGWKHEDWEESSTIDLEDVEEVRKVLLEEYKNWNEDLKELLRCFDEVVPRTLYMMPVGARWSSKSKFTCIGDAAHLMTPFAGQGVNIAMADAMTLAEQIIQNPHNLARAVKEYETWMFPTAAKVTQKTWSNLLDRFEEGGTAKFAAYLNEAVQQLSNKGSSQEAAKTKAVDQVKAEAKLNQKTG